MKKKTGKVNVEPVILYGSDITGLGACKCGATIEHVSLDAHGAGERLCPGVRRIRYHCGAVLSTSWPYLHDPMPRDHFSEGVEGEKCGAPDSIKGCEVVTLKDRLKALLLRPKAATND
jgi:hypothetical protein